MSATLWTWSNLYEVTAIDLHERPIRCTETPLGSSLQMTRTGHTDLTAKGLWAMQSCTAGHKDKLEDKDRQWQLEHYFEHPDESGVPLDLFFTPHGAPAMVVYGKRRPTGSMMTKLTRNTFAYTIAVVNQVEYTSAMKVIEAKIFHWVEDALFDVLQQCQLDSHLVRTVHELTELDQSLSDIVEIIIVRMVQIRVVTQALKLLISKINTECHLQRKLWRPAKADDLAHA